MDKAYGWSKQKQHVVVYVDGHPAPAGWLLPGWDPGAIANQIREMRGAGRVELRCYRSGALIAASV